MNMVSFVVLKYIKYNRCFVFCFLLYNVTPIEWRNTPLTNTHEPPLIHSKLKHVLWLRKHFLFSQGAEMALLTCRNWSPLV